jgi:hypothetical protein
MQRTTQNTIKQCKNIRSPTKRKYIIQMNASRHFRNKKREYLKDKIDELATNNKKPEH